MNSKRGQVTLFVIIAVLIVALVILAIILIPKINKPKTPSIEPTDPEAYIGDCIKDDLKSITDLVGKQGGSLAQENCVFYKDFCRTYLCYTNIPYSTCVNQQPLLKDHIESEIKGKLQERQIISTCINEFASNARRKGYQVSTCSESDFNVTLFKGKVAVFINCQITLEKETTKRFTSITPSLSSPLYDFVLITNRIILEEQQKKTFDYVNFLLVPENRWVEITLFRINDNIKIYSLKEKSSNKEFTFALSSWS